MENYWVYWVIIIFTTVAIFFTILWIGLRSLDWDRCKKKDQDDVLRFQSSIVPEMLSKRLGRKFRRSSELDDIKLETSTTPRVDVVLELGELPIPVNRRSMNIQKAPPDIYVINENSQTVRYIMCV